MNCPVCHHEDHHVLRTEPRDDAIRRVRRCDRCGHSWATLEHAETSLAADRKTLAQARELAAILKSG